MTENDIKRQFEKLEQKIEESTFAHGCSKIAGAIVLGIALYFYYHGHPNPWLVLLGIFGAIQAL